MNTLTLISAINSALLISVLLILILPRRVKRVTEQSVLLDTSAIMDGRIVEVVRSGFVPKQLVISRFVIAELQLLADKADHTKRERARYGLQIIQDLQGSRNVTVKIVSDDIDSETGVDEKLVKLALSTGALLFTTDYNLLKVAEIEGIRVLNINELAQNLRLTHIPGETISIKIVAKGQESSQGVGYLDDGTMVVVDKAGSSIGKKMTIEVTRSLQTAAGRMMFAKIVTQKKSAASSGTKKISSPSATTRKRTPAKGKGSSNSRRRPMGRKEEAEQSLIDAIESR